MRSKNLLSLFAVIALMMLGTSSYAGEQPTAVYGRGANQFSLATGSPGELGLLKVLAEAFALLRRAAMDGRITLAEAVKMALRHGFRALYHCSHADEEALLLDAWQEAYQFSKHTIHQGHVAARTGDALLRFVNDTLIEQGIEHAATGLAAAWALTRFATFRIATFYLPTDPSPALCERLGYREDPRGANLWLVVPNDAGVFQGAIEKGGIRCVHPVQVYVDLKDHPERATEAAERLRTELLNWRRDG